MAGANPPYGKFHQVQLRHVAVFSEDHPGYVNDAGRKRFGTLIRTRICKNAFYGWHLHGFTGMGKCFCDLAMVYVPLVWRQSHPGRKLRFNERVCESSFKKIREWNCGVRVER